MKKFPETNNLQRLNHEEIEIQHRPITSNAIKSVIKNLPTWDARLVQYPQIN